LKLFDRDVLKNSIYGSKWKNLISTLVSIFVTFSLIEIVFTFIPRSHSIEASYAAVNWKRYYMNKNERGFRDSPQDQKDFDKEIMLFLGDSFTEGAGIANPEFRFANLISNEVEDCYETYICAKGGYSTLTQSRALKKLNFTPKKIIYQYCGNDIDADIKKLKKQHSIVLYDDLSWPLKFVVKSSYLFNFVYWRYPHDNLNNYLDEVLEAYNDDLIFDKHLKSLIKILKYAKTIDAEIYIIILPFFQDIKYSEELYGNKISKVIDDFPYDKVYNIQLNSKFEDVPINDRMIHSNDAHASKIINQIIANEILKYIQDDCI